VLQCVVQSVAVCCSECSNILRQVMQCEVQCVAVHNRVLQCVAVCGRDINAK